MGYEFRQRYQCRRRGDQAPACQDRQSLRKKAAAHSPCHGLCDGGKVMTPANEAYSLLRRLTLAFTIVAILVLSLAGGLLYHSLSLQLRQRDDDEISVKLNEFLHQAHQFGAAQAVARNTG